ncbi:MAG: ribonuclease P protein component [Ignavibacteriaceae bacterium]|nr:ribonuclease P protein component [Ignavibacteriaceae bacterium]
MTKKVKIFDRLKSENDIEIVYNRGKVIISEDRKIKATYLSIDNGNSRTRIATTVSSKTGNSVWRNRLKRIIRESLTQEKVFLREIVSKNKSELSMIFSPYKINQVNLQQLFLKDIKPAVTDILININKATKHSG